MALTRIAIPFFTAALTLASPGLAQVLGSPANSDATVRDNLCVGGECADDPTADFADFNYSAVEIRDYRTRLDFIDSSEDDFPNTNWALLANEPLISIAGGGTEYFALQDSSAGTVPFTIRGGAPSNAFYMAPSGQVGFGTMLPQADLHLVSNTIAKLRVENTDYGADWEVGVGSDGFAVADAASLTYPFLVENGAPSYAFWIADTGNVGLGTFAPSAPLELSGPESYNYFRITATGAAVNQSVDITFTGGPLGTGQLRYNIVDGDAQEMSLDADGNMVLDGTLTTGGPSCSGGCDAVFTDQQIIPAQEYAAQMWANGHLPHVGPTGPDAPFNMTEKMGGMLNALEHAHIYIEGLHGQNAALERRVETQEAQIAALIARLEALEQQN